MAPVSYPRALAMAALQATLSGTWIAAGELAPARRRLARFGAVALVAGIGYVVSPPSSDSSDSPLTLRLVAPGSANALGSAAPDLAASAGVAGSESATGSGSVADTSSQAGSGDATGSDLPAGSASDLSDKPGEADAGEEFEMSFDKRKAIAGAAIVALSVAAIAGRRRLEKRWLAGLTRNGHPHPTRGLAVRMAAVEFAGQFALQLADRRRARSWNG